MNLAFHRSQHVGIPVVNIVISESNRTCDLF